MFYRLLRTHRWDYVEISGQAANILGGLDRGVQILSCVNVISLESAIFSAKRGVFFFSTSPLILLHSQSNQLFMILEKAVFRFHRQFS